MIPKKCLMPDISSHKQLIPSLLASSLVGGSELSRNSTLYRTIFIRLIDKAVFEYNESRSTILNQIKEMQRSDEETAKTGRILYILSFTNHFENCINTTARLLKILERIKNDDLGANIPREHKRLVKAYSKSIPDIRNTVEHMDKEIHMDNIAEGKPVMLAIENKGDKVQIAGYKINFNDLAITLKNLHAIAIQLV